MDTFDRRNLLAAAGMMSVAAVSGRAHAGPLNPPAGSVTGTSKPLGEMEPRIAINATNTPGDANSVFSITQRGSYYLTDNVIVPSGKNGIGIVTDHATVDLNGFAIIGQSGSVNGVVAPNPAGGQTHHVRNGVIKTMGAAGISLPGTQGSLLEDITVEDCQTTGFQIGGTQTRIVRCASYRNNAGGFSINADGVLVDCVSAQNAGTGFTTINNVILERCSSSFDGAGFSLVAGVVTACSYSGSGVGFTFNGSVTLAYCRVVGGTAAYFSTSPSAQARFLNCSADSAGIGFQVTGGSAQVYAEGCTASSCSSNGFSFADGATVVDCVSRNNAGFGISIVSNGTIRRCTLANNTVQYAVNCTNSGTIDSCHFVGNAVGGILCGSNNSITNCTFVAHQGTGAAVRCTSSGNAIDNCQFSVNATAITVAFGGCTITRNRLTGNTTKYNLNGTNFVGPSITTAAGMATAPAWANIEF